MALTVAFPLLRRFQTQNVSSLIFCLDVTQYSSCWPRGQQVFHFQQYQELFSSLHSFLLLFVSFVLSFLTSFFLSFITHIFSFIFYFLALYILGTLYIPCWGSQMLCQTFSSALNCCCLILITRSCYGSPYTDRVFPWTSHSLST